MSRPREQRTSQLSQREKPGKTRAQKAAGRGETPSKRALRGAQKTGRQDMETGVRSRARRRIQGQETVADLRTGARAGRNSKRA